MATTAPADGKAFFKRDTLLELEKAAQARWAAEKIFEENAPEDQAEFEAKNKHMVTFPYPYMNGRLHIGHSYSLSKCEFAVGYERLKGKKCLFPFGFHCTGMPIKACADKLAREMELYGNPPNFPADEAPKEGSAKHSKVEAKTGKATYQWQIMRSMGIPDDQISSFADPMHWLQYFPPMAMEDLRRFGLKTDWRRSFITTPANPYYDSFVRWQFETLNDLKRVKFGKRHTIYSPKDGQPCMDHDRQTGEGVGCQEYTLIKMRVLEPLPEKLASLAGKTVFLVAGTLRPETMYGQTNCWVGPDLDYGAYQVNDTEVFICTEHAARNMAFQGFSPEFGKVVKLLDLKGQDIMGIALHAPLTSNEKIYTLPMLTIKPNKGTGIVTSVPSDSPDDYAALRDLKNKQPLREKYGITDEMVLPYEVIPVLDIPELGTTAAIAACEQFKVKSQNDADALQKAKDLVYLKGFYEGVMVAGPYKGTKVADAKGKIKQEMIDAGDAAVYYEPEREVMSRSADKCVVALCDQWYLDYGLEEWKEEVRKRMANTEMYSDETKHNFQKTLDWLHEWACSRSFGLGTKLPWDPQYLIESLSDSTIYMAYYTVAHLLHGGTLDGTGTSPAGVRPEQMTRAVWDYIYLDAPEPQTDIPLSTLQAMRREFKYWYPVDLRCSGKDLISNHLTFFLYTHAAIWGPENFPRAVRANGHLLINSEKMSKSTGNFKTLDECVRDYGADATRFALADAGDSVEDANFALTTVNAAILRLYTQLEWTKEFLASKETMRTGPATMFHDKVFENAINLAIAKADHAYSRMMYRDALKTGFYDLQSARDWYREVQGASSEGLNRDLLMRFVEVQALLLAPFCPHYCEAVWALLGKPESIMRAAWPAGGAVDDTLVAASAHAADIASDLRIKLKNYMTPKKGKTEAPAKPGKLSIQVTASYPDWQAKSLDVLKDLYNNDRSKYEDNKAVLNLLKDLPEVKPMLKKVMPFVQFTKDAVRQRGPEALDSHIAFDELKTLSEYTAYLARNLEVPTVEVVEAGANTEAVPLKPWTVWG
eukprot:comp20847_c0_seq1/m.27562 comp20847_c0_seq1/g.27562  ORF comp20847_c0_seq1/g.27562 comp20847_c0_seq1/m.27562 type:complete len:1047 (-) comp20847_c0_seq1:394-3534(-)